MRQSDAFARVASGVAGVLLSAARGRRADRRDAVVKADTPEPTASNENWCG